MFGGGGDPLQAAIGGGSGGGGMMSSLSQRPSQQSQTLMAMQEPIIGSIIGVTGVRDILGGAIGP